MLFVLSGPSTVGKSYSVSHFCNYYNFSTVVPFTTREPRITEAEGTHYHFRSLEEIKKISKDFTLGYWSQPFKNGDWYGYTNILDRVANDKSPWIIHATTDIALELKQHNNNVIIIFLDFETDTIMYNKITQRFSNSEPELKKRLEHARRERSFAKNFDTIIKADYIEIIIEKLIKFIESKIGKLSSFSKQSGVLVDSEILYLLNSNSNLKIKNPLVDNYESYIKGCSVELTLSSKMFVPQKRFLSIRRVFDLASGNKKIINKLFKEKEVDDIKGIIIFPNEFFLCSSNEKVTLPPNIFGLLTGRSSYSRLGLSVELSQNIVQPGHDDIIPLQIKNNLPFPVRLYPNIKIAQIVLIQLEKNSHIPYNLDTTSKYLGSNDDIRTKYYQDTLFKDINKRKEMKKLNIDMVKDLFQLFSFILASFITIILPFVPTAFADNLKIVLIISGISFFSISVYKFYTERIKRT